MSNLPKRSSDYLPKRSSDYLPYALKLCDLPRDLTEEIFSRLPVTSLRGARFTCKKLNTLTKDRSFVKKHIAKATKKKLWNEFEFQVVMMLEYRISLMRFNLLTPSVEPIGKLISLADADRVDISKIFHCYGLLLCVTKDTNSRLKDTNSRLVVWNPYLGQTRWIEPRISYRRLDRYAFGYDKSRRIHKILRFVDDYDLKVKLRICEFEIYSFKTNSWKVIDVTPHWLILPYRHGVSLEGNSYWYAQEKPPLEGPDISDLPDFLLCFDFTTERFGPRLRLPFHAFFDTVTLSSVRDNQLAILFQERDRPAFPLEIWITNKIEPNVVSWRKFLAVDMKPLTGFMFGTYGASFFVDEKKKVAVILDKHIKKNCPIRNVASIIGKKGYFKQVDLGESTIRCYPLVCSYTPSSVQI